MRIGSGVLKSPKLQPVSLRRIFFHGTRESYDRLDPIL
jgi:hypothetical protein